MTLKVEHVLSIAAPPERVWKAWVHDINGWWIQPYYNDEERATGHRLEPKLGGQFIETWGDGGEGFLVGTVIEWLPPLRLAFTWTEVNFGGAYTLVRIELVPEGSGTRMTFTHSGFEQVADAEQERENHQGGWGDLVEHLKAYVEKG